MLLAFRMVKNDVSLQILEPEKEEEIRTSVPYSSYLKKMNETQKLFICCAGIFLCYFYYGILQEKITRVPYGDANEKFVYQQSLVFSQCIVNALFAFAAIKVTSGEAGKDTTPTYMYLWCAMSYLGAMLASNTALRYVNYPTQVLGKSCKPIPVMILGVLIARKRYPLVKYFSVLLIVLGVALFLFKDKKSNSVESTGWGEGLLLISLTLDGLTGASQDKMRAEYTTKAYPMMLAVNKWSACFLGVGVLFTGEVFRFLAFVERYPFVLWNMILFSITSAIGQNFIFVTVTSFGPLTTSVVTTTRKFFTILFSVLFLGNAITGRQWLAVMLVFTGLTIDSLFGKARKTS